jgi:hypothetical protein
MEISLKVVGLSVEIRIEHVPDMGEERYRCANPFDVVC